MYTGTAATTGATWVNVATVAVTASTLTVTYGTALGAAWAGEKTYTGVNCVTAVAS